MEKLAIVLSLGALAVSLAGAAWLSFAWATRRHLHAASSLIAALPCGLLVSAAAASWAANDSYPWPRPEQLISLAAAAGWLVLRLGIASRLTPWLDPPQWRFAIVTHVLLLATTGWQFHSTAVSGAAYEFAQYVQKGVTADDAVLVTDQGRVFPMFHFDLQGQTYEDAPPLTHVTAAELERPSSARRPVKIAATDAQSNCHGWVFTNGRYGISETVVDALLQDNGYRQVAAPSQGDVIVYRDASGVVLHTGRVHRVHENGEIWIESKWGPGGRYRHLPQDQSYSGKMEYYRSLRPDHCAQIVSTPVGRGDVGRLGGIASLARRPLRRVSL